MIMDPKLWSRPSWGRTLTSYIAILQGCCSQNIQFVYAHISDLFIFRIVRILIINRSRSLPEKYSATFLWWWEGVKGGKGLWVGVEQSLKFPTIQ